MGTGTSRGANDLNYIGNSIKTRFLFSVIRGNLYADKNAYRLKRLVAALAKELTFLFTDGVEIDWHGHRVRVFFACLGMKGDWPALTKLGQLERHHLRDGAKQVGICHLCKAGMPDHPWHHSSFLELQPMHLDSPIPWTQPSSLFQVPQIGQDQRHSTALMFSTPFTRVLRGTCAPMLLLLGGYMGITFIVSISFPTIVYRVKDHKVWGLCLTCLWFRFFNL